MRTQFLLLATVASMALTAAANPVPQDGGEQNNGQYTAWTETSTSTTVEATSTTTASEQVPTWTESASVSVTETESTSTSTDSATATYATDAAAWTQVADLVDNNSATSVAEATASASAESTAAAEPTQVYEGGETTENSVVAGEQKSGAIRSSASAAAAIVALYGAGIVLV